MSGQKIKLVYAVFNGQTTPTLHDVDEAYVDLSQSVADLKAKIVPAIHLQPQQYQLWKVKHDFPLDPSHLFQQHWNHLDFDAENGTVEKMYNFECISFYFDCEPHAGHLHVAMGLKAPSDLQNFLEMQHFISQVSAKRTLDNTENLSLSLQTKRQRIELLWRSETIYRAESDSEIPDTPVLPRNVDFNSLIATPNIISIDKTKYIEALDKTPQYQFMFLRPRGWGKSTFLDTLSTYYDKTKRNSFGDTFGQLYIGQHPTKDHNSLLVLSFNFSSIRTLGSVAETLIGFNREVYLALERFLKANAALLGNPNMQHLLIKDGATESLQHVLDLVRDHNEQLFVGVDDFDAPATSCLLSNSDDQYHVVTGLFKSEFYAIIRGACGSVIKKYWLTGVLPVFRDGISPLDSTEIISIQQQFHGVCGLTEKEVETIAQNYLHPACTDDEILQVSLEMKRWYSGYRFSPHRSDAADPLYNPQLVFTHLRNTLLSGGESRALDEVHVTMTHSNMVLKTINTGHNISVHDLFTLMSGNVHASVMTDFGVAEVQHLGRNPAITWTLLYYFGVVTHATQNQCLSIPNVTMRNLVLRRFREYLEHEEGARFEPMRDSFNAFMNGPGNLSPLLRLLVQLQPKPLHSIRTASESNLLTTVEVMGGDNDRCITELCVVVDPQKRHDDGRFEFVDFFVTASVGQSSELSIPVIKFKDITLRGIWKGMVGNRTLEPSHQDLLDLCKDLRGAEESGLMQRRYCYWEGSSKSWQTSTLQEFKDDALENVKQILDILRHGVAHGGTTGIFDRRVRCVAGDNRLDGYAVMSIRGLRVFSWKVETVQTKWFYWRA